MIIRQHVQHVKDAKKSNPITLFRKASFLKFATLPRNRKWHISKLTTLPRALYQPHAKNNKGREQVGEHTTSRQNTGKGKGGREGEGGERRKHTEPNPDMQKSKQRKAEQATKQKHSTARHLKQDSTGKEQTHS